MEHVPLFEFAIYGAGLATGMIAVRLRDYLIVRRARRQFRARITVGGLV